MTTGFGVDGTALDAHVRFVEELAERTRLAADDARPLQLDAYGLVGQDFASLADDAVRTGARAVTELAESVRRHADGVRLAAGGYLSVDQAVATMLGECR